MILFSESLDVYFIWSKLLALISYKNTCTISSELHVEEQMHIAV